MEFIKELEKLALDQEQIDKSYVDFYNSDYTRFKELFKKKLLKSPLRKYNAKKLLNHMDIVLKYTNLSNIEWTGYDALLSQAEFVPKLVEALPNYQFPETISELLVNHIYNWLSIDHLDKCDTLFNGNMLDYLANLKLDTPYYYPFFNQMNEETQLQFLNVLLEKEVPISSVNFELKGDNKNFIYENILYFAKSSEALYSLKNSVSDNEKALNEINEYIDDHKEQAMESIMYEVKHTASINNDTLKDVIRLVIDDVMKNEDAKFSDIMFGSGAFSAVLKIKDKVVKIGTKRQSSTFPNNPYIVKPLLRKTLEDDNEQCFIEVTERVDTSQNVSDEDLYQLYKNMRDIGLIWTDIASRNVGRLLKDNVINWRSNLEPSNKVLELDSSRGKDITLKKGDLVLLDADFIYDAKNFKFNNKRPIVNIFEERYQKEKSIGEKNIEKINKVVDDMVDANNYREEEYYQKGFAAMKIISLITFSTLMVSLFIFLYFYTK